MKKDNKIQNIRIQIEWAHNNLLYLCDFKINELWNIN